MEPPPGLNIREKGQVCRLAKSHHGLKQANRQCFDKLSSFLISINFTQSKYDYSIFIKKTYTNFTILLLYVDEIIFARNFMTKIEHIKTLLYNNL